MSQTFIPQNPDLKITKIKITTGDDLLSKEYMAYLIEIHTDDGGVITIEGCHDTGPDLTAEEGLFESN